MTGNRCLRRRNMTAGRRTEEKLQSIPRVPIESPEEIEEVQKTKNLPVLGLDLYTQAQKALSERSPFDKDEDQVSRVGNLPTELSNLLNRNADNNNKRNRKLRPGPPPKTRGRAIWDETEGYFRNYNINDVEELRKLCSLRFLGEKKWFLIPRVGKAAFDFGNFEKCSFSENGNVGIKEEVKNEVEEELGSEISVEIDRVNKECGVINREEENGNFFSSGVEWLLGAKGKVNLTTERPSKKRKLLGGDAGLEKLLISRPIKGSLFLCDYCCMGDNGGDSNRLIVCSSCDVVVHQKCYGVHGDITGSWLCSWCKCKSSDLVRNHDKPCVLCAGKGGALKPVRRGGDGNENGGGYVDFAHLFCTQWVPEVYIEDTKTMEPVMNVEGINDTRLILVCNVCKVKRGACVRCSNGTCRTSLHPICAREAGYRMEIWGKFGSNDVELRAYCSKHSKDQNSVNSPQSEQLSVASGSDSHDTNHQNVTSMPKKPNKLKITRKNGDNVDVILETTDTKKPEGNLLPEGPNSRFQSKIDEAQRPVGTLEKITDDDASTSDSPDYAMILKKLIDRGKVNLKVVASKIGISPDILASISSDNHMTPNLRSKVVTWLRENAHVGVLQKNLKLRIKSSLTSKDDNGAVEDSSSDLIASLDVPVNPVSPHRRTKSNIKILKGNKMVSPIDGENGVGSGIVANGGDDITEDADSLKKGSLSALPEKLFVEPDGINENPPSNFLKCEEGDQDQKPTLSEHNTLLNSVQEKSTCSALNEKIISTSYIHPLVHEKIAKMYNTTLPAIATYEVKGSMDREFSSPEVSSGTNDLIEHLNSGDKISRFDGSQLEQLASNVDLLKSSPGDEVEGELLYYQHWLLHNAITTKPLADDLISEVVRNIPREIDVTSKRKWDDVIVHQYMLEVKETKKQGRKEKRHKEAQEILSAATAAAAASSRISSLRKDIIVDESAHQENLTKVNTSTGRPGPYYQQMPLAKETVSKLTVSNVNKEQSRTCDICRRLDTLLNPVLVCSGCKVAVHLDCYRSDKDFTGPWYCELCEEFSSKNSEALTANTCERHQLAVECGLCGVSGGAFRKSTDGQWVHAFCAEWMLESTYKRGQPTPIEGMELVVKGSECYICHHKQGVCLKCNYGHCHSMFHPSCARSAGLYMIGKSSGSKSQHKAYCQKHSLEQRAKALSQRHSVEELKSLKQVRVELERLRLLCERIIRREKLKRELVLCSQDVLISSRDNTALSALVRIPFSPNDNSSESATTSLRSEPILRSDDVTVDSTVPGKRRVKFPLSKNINDQQTDESSTSHLVTRKSSERVAFAGKQIPHRPSFVSQNISDGDGDVERFRKV